MNADTSFTSFVGIEFANLSYSQVAAQLDDYSRSDKFSFVATPNVDHVVLLHSKLQDEVSEQFRAAYAAATIRTCDSRVLQALAWFRGVSLHVVTGSDLTDYLFEHGCLNGQRVAIIGGDDTMLDELRQLYPAIDLAQHVPPMGVLQNEPAIREIEAFVAGSKFNYIFFAIGAPRSEIIAYRCSKIEGASGVALCIGASIEFLLKRKARAPQWMRALRLEWLFRLLSEPRRLWRRYLVSGPRVLFIIGNWQKG